MEVEKHISNTTGTSSYEPDARREDIMGAGRSYECTFCKGGFTNAQALGGHMNIHRKDKLKASIDAKQKKNSSNNSNNNYQQDSSLSRKSNYDHRAHYTTIREQQQHKPYYNEQFHYYLPPSNPSYRHHHSNQYTTRYASDFMGANDLSLKVGPTIGEDEGRKGGWDEEHEVDLELRLGHHKYY